MMKPINVLMLMLFIVSCRKEDLVPIKTTTTTTKNDTTFYGYKVNSTINDYRYWQNGTPIATDYFVSTFQPILSGQSHTVRATACVTADFNKDGYIDIFNPGFAFSDNSGQKIVGFSFLVWNVEKKIYEHKNLFNDTSFTHFGENIGKTIPIDLNKDNYLDFVIFDNGDEGITNSKDQPIRIVLSDGKGKYDLKEIETSETETYVSSANETRLVGWHKFGGDVADLNGDGIPDLVITCNVVTYIYWGITQYPYFTKTNRAMMTMDNSWGNVNNNGFNESCTHCANFAFNATIVDVNNDKQNDVIISTAEYDNNTPFATHQRILINQGKGRFNDNNILVLPDYKIPHNETHDYIPDDINGDGKIDLIGLGSLGTDTWDIFVYMQIGRAHV